MAKTMADDSKAPQVNGRQALLLQVWLSPSFPVGAFAYSHGLERAVEAGLITGRADLAVWIADVLAHGSIRGDLILLAATWRAMSRADWARLHDIAELGAALHPSAERRLESITQGGSFLKAVSDAWPAPAVDKLRKAWTGEVAYPVAVGVAAAGHDLALGPLLEAYATAFAGNLISAAIRLGVIGQTDAQRILAELMPALLAGAEAARGSSLDDLGTATWSADLCSLEHETQYTRLFRS
jgi:urease accessory protein